MGEPPEQHDIASRERNPEHDQLSAEASTLDELARARSRSTLSNSQVANENIVGLWRTGALLVVFFQLIYAAEHHYASASTFDATLRLHLANIAIGVVFFLSSFTSAMPRYWRQLALSVCTALLVSTTAICTTSTRVEALFVSVLVIVVGAGTMAPWDWGWQAAISIVGMICFFVLGRTHGIVDSDPSMYWLGLMTAVGLGQSNVYLQTKNRRAIAQNLADRLSSDQKLTDSEEKFRQIFQQSGDMVVVTNLDTGAILEVNNQFVVRSRVPRELVVGRIDTDFNFFAEPAAREQFMKELHESGVVKNLEVQLNGIGYGRPMPALISAVVVRLNNQNCAIIVVREISDVREAERKLRNSETTLAQNLRRESRFGYDHRRVDAAFHRHQSRILARNGLQPGRGAGQDLLGGGRLAEPRGIGQLLGLDDPQRRSPQHAGELLRQGWTPHSVPHVRCNG